MLAYASDMRIVVCWVPGHSSIRGNEIADRYAAAAALRTRVDEPLVPYLDMKPAIRRRLREMWQLEWDKESNNKLHTVKPYIGKYLTEKQDRFTEVSICRLRIGHTHATHAYLLNGALPPACDKCGERLSVLHVLTECTSMNDARKRHFPKLYTHNIPLHPSLFLGDEPMFPYKRLLTYLADVHFLKLISYRA